MEVDFWLARSGKFVEVTCLTAEFGTEVHMLEMVDVLVAFLARIAGKPWSVCKSLVNHSDGLLPKCLRLVGWSHTMGTIMKTAMSECPTWDSRLNQVRALCRFFSNDSWRTFLRKTFVAHGIHVGKLLDHFLSVSRNGDMKLWLLPSPHY